MREILCKGKTLTGYWIEGYYLNRSNGEEEIHCIMERFPATVSKRVIPETVGQYTGLTDKNGKKIFEGDIIKTVTNSFDRDEFVTEIKFGARSGVQGFYLANGRMMFYFGQKDLTVMDDTEVIGNIHDNPKLLKGDTSDA